MLIMSPFLQQLIALCAYGLSIGILAILFILAVYLTATRILPGWPVTSASFLEMQNALITVYQPIIYFWLILFLVSCIVVGIYLIVIRIAKNRM